MIQISSTNVPYSPLPTQWHPTCEVTSAVVNPTLCRLVSGVPSDDRPARESDWPGARHTNDWTDTPSMDDRLHRRDARQITTLTDSQTTLSDSQTTLSDRQTTLSDRQTTLSNRQTTLSDGQITFADGQMAQGGTQWRSDGTGSIDL